MFVLNKSRWRIDCGIFFALSVLMLIPFSKADENVDIQALVSELSAESFQKRAAAQAKLTTLARAEPGKMSKLIQAHLKKETCPEALARLRTLAELAEKAEALLPVNVSTFSEAALKKKDWTARLGYTGERKDWAKYQAKGNQVEIDSTLKTGQSAIFCRAHKSKIPHTS